MYIFSMFVKRWMLIKAIVIEWQNLNTTWSLKSFTNCRYAHLDTVELCYNCKRFIILVCKNNTKKTCFITDRACLTHRWLKVSVLLFFSLMSSFLVECTKYKFIQRKQPDCIFWMPCCAWVKQRIFDQHVVSDAVS